jgi:hypothetical protein
MRRSWALAGPVLAILAVVSVRPAEGAAREAQQPVARLAAKRPHRIVLTTAAYRLSLSKGNGAILELVDRRTSTRLLSGQAGCAWSVSLANGDGFGGCSFGRVTADRFSYRWAPKASTLTMRYASGSAGRASATVTIVAAADHLDLRLRVESDFGRPVAAVLFPADVTSDVAAVQSVYTPTFLPGIRLLSGFFATPRRNVERYPSRWAFADFEAADVGRSHVAVYSVNPAPSPVAPVDVGVIHDAGGQCAGGRFCLTHAFQTWLMRGSTWSSPVVRVRVGGSVETSVLAYRQDNGIDRYPSLAEKLGARLDTLARAPLVKADLWKGLPRFQSWGAALRKLPSPSLLHPVAFQPGGHDEDYPDFLPPDPKWGTTAELNAALDDARSLGDVVMPYLNVSWWDTQAPSISELPPPLTATDIAMQTSAGNAVTEQFGDKNGYIVSPFAPYVRQRVDRLMQEWQTEVPVECLFFDQIGARPWRRDFNPDAPTPLAYDDGWLATFAAYRDRCLMTEDGWDRLGDAFVGFHGGVLEMQREHNWPDERWGPGNWAPYPIATWLLHDKVLMYQHDLYPGTFTADPEVLLFNVAFGMMLSYNWDGETDSLDSPWLARVGALQRTLGPLVAGRPLTAFRYLEPNVTESVFGDYSIVANWSSTSSVARDGYTIAPLGFLARRDGGQLVAGVLGRSWSGVTVVGAHGSTVY